MSTADESKRTHLFISYAVEDSALAGWLARKLAAEGYAVWFDRMKLLGGEPWPLDIDDAIKERTFRMVALLSQHSMRKPNPSKERALALNISRSRGVSDFLIPLKIDAAELDWLMTDLSYLSFNRGWAEGWRQLLKKLRAVNAPKHLDNYKALAISTFDAGAGLISDTPEQIVTNILRVKVIPEVLHVFSIEDSLSVAKREQLKNVWSRYSIDDRTALAFGPPPAAYNEGVQATKAQFLWRDTAHYSNVPTEYIVRHLVERTVVARLVAFDCQPHPKRRGFYLASGFLNSEKLWFIGRKGKRTWRKIKGRSKVVRFGKPPEMITHQFAFDVRRWRLSSDFVAFQVRPSLMFRDEAGALILDDRVGPLRRKITKSWWNDEWIDRTLAATEIILAAPPIPGDGVVLDGSLLCLEATRSLNEDALGGPSEPDEPAESDEPEEIRLDLDDHQKETNDEPEDN